MSPIDSILRCDKHQFSKSLNREAVAAWFIFSAGVILLVAGAAKVWTALGDAALLTARDPIIGLRFRELMLSVGIIEILFAIACFYTRQSTVAACLVNSFATSVFIYRLGLKWIGWTKPCGCLGDLTDAIGVSEQTADKVMQMLLVYLLIGSCSVLLLDWKPAAGEKREPPSNRAPATS
jgi:hypothetical protein